MQKVYDWPEPTSSTNAPLVVNSTGTPQITHYGYYPYYLKVPLTLHDGTVLGNGNTRDGCIRYVQAALWYCQQKSVQSTPNLPPSFWNPTLLSHWPPSASNIISFEPGTPNSQKWMQVQAMRFLSHAATCLTSWFPITAPVPNPNNIPDLTTGIPITSVTLGTTSGPPGTILITNDMIQYFHERSLKLIMEFASCFPYDWAVPRPIERTLMVDFPLLQYDLWSTPRSGTIFGTPNMLGGSLPAETAMQWAPLSPRPIHNIGLGQTYPLNQNGGQNKLDGTIVPGGVSNLMGNLDHYTLGMPFDASQRCREIVFWTVDWQSYEDFETLPSAPLDASRYPISGPRMVGGSANPGTQYRDFGGRMQDVVFVDPHLYAFRNPEKTELFINGTPMGQPSGTSTSSNEMLNGWTNGGAPDDGPYLGNRQVFSGIFGADRNFNQKIDRGPIPRSVRLRAVQVARFNYYDPRIPCLLR